MKCLPQYKWTIGLSVLSLIAGTAQSFAIPRNITIPDGVAPGTFFNGGPLGSAREDNETEDGTLAGQKWDLEEMLWESNFTKQLTIIGGFNFQNGAFASPANYNSGDIFIDVNGGLLPNPSEIGGNAYNTINGNLGYDFVIHFNDRSNMNPVADMLNFATLNSFSYQVIDIRGSGVQLYDVLYGSLNESSPFIWKSGGTIIGSTGSPGLFSSYSSDAAVNTAFSGATGWENVASEAGAGNHNHYALTVSLANITSILGVSLDEAKFTIGCGNDMIKGDFSRNPQRVPDGGMTIALLGVALGGLSVIGRYANKGKA